MGHWPEMRCGVFMRNTRRHPPPGGQGPPLAVPSPRRRAAGTRCLKSLSPIHHATHGAALSNFVLRDHGGRNKIYFRPFFIAKDVGRGHSCQPSLELKRCFECAVFYRGGPVSAPSLSSLRLHMAKRSLRPGAQRNSRRRRRGAPARTALRVDPRGQSRPGDTEAHDPR